MQKAPEILVKVVLLGPSGVGKSSILKRYTDQNFQENEDSTMGASFHTKRVTYKNKVYRFQIWDTAGQEKYAPLARMYYRDAQAILLVYDITSKDSFISLNDWHSELKTKGPGSVVSIVVGNKTDLSESEQVDEDTGRQYAESIGAGFGRTSAKENEGIRELFDQLLVRLQGQLEEETEDNSMIAGSQMRVTIRNDAPNSRKDTEKSGCC